MEDSKYFKKVGETIRTIRLEKGIKQVDLAYECDMDKQSLRRLEAGKTNPTLKTLRKISKALEIRVVDLLDFE